MKQKKLSIMKMIRVGRTKKGLNLTVRKLSQYEQEEKIVENLNSEETNDGRQKEDQIRTVLEGAENQTVRPKKMIFKIPKADCTNQKFSSAWIANNNDNSYH